MTRFAFYGDASSNQLERQSLEFAYLKTRTIHTQYQRLVKPASECTLCLVTTAGIHLKSDEPFEVKGGMSPQYRTLNVDRLADIVFQYDGYYRNAAREDINVILPADTFKKFENEGRIKKLLTTAVSFWGKGEDDLALAGNARHCANFLKSKKVDAAIIVTSSFDSNEIASHICNFIESAGISTVMLATVKEIPEQIRVPRCAFLNFPFGFQFGRPGETELREKICGDLLRILEKAETAGKIEHLRHHWDGHAPVKE